MYIEYENVNNIYLIEYRYNTYTLPMANSDDHITRPTLLLHYHPIEILHRLHLLAPR